MDVARAALSVAAFVFFLLAGACAIFGVGAWREYGSGASVILVFAALFGWMAAVCLAKSRR